LRDNALGLGSPVNVEAPAFVRPEWYIFYSVGDKVVTLTGVLNESHKSVTDIKDTHRYLFSGYWAVEQCEKDGQAIKQRRGVNRP